MTTSTTARSARRTAAARVVDAWNGSSWAVRLIASGTVMVAIASGASERVPMVVGISMAVLVAAALVDLHERRLPNNTVALALIVMVGAVIFGTSGPAVGGALAGAAVCSGPVLALHLASPRSMGFGDVKLSLVVGTALGTIDWQLALWALAIGSAASAAFALAHQRSTIAFGPGLVGAGIALMALTAASPALHITER